MTRHSDYRSEMNHHPDTPSRDDLEVLLRGRSDQADPLEVFGEVLRALRELPAPPPSPARGRRSHRFVVTGRNTQPNIAVHGHERPERQPGPAKWT